MIEHNPYLKSVVSLSLAVVLFSGCGGGDGFKGKRGTVSGKITVEGTPVPKGTQVVFVGASDGYTATGTVGDNGAYSLKINGSPNIPAIKYQVQITPPAPPGTSAQQGASTKGASTSVTDPTAATKAAVPNKKPNQPTVETGPFPIKYSSIRTSGLAFEVQAGANSCDFKLDAIKAK